MSRVKVVVRVRPPLGSEVYETRVVRAVSGTQVAVNSDATNENSGQQAFFFPFFFSWLL